jgi:hypothetical protein
MVTRYLRIVAPPVDVGGDQVAWIPLEIPTTLVILGADGFVAGVRTVAMAVAETCPSSATDVTPR